jgi:membrane-bound lytic murein transglycosylase B
LCSCALQPEAAGALDKARPLMRPEIRQFVDEMVRDDGFDRAELAKVMAKAEKQQSILDAISRPAERSVPWFEYRARFLTEKRIGQGTEFWTEHAKRMDGVGDPDLAATVAGILGVETSYGRITGRYRVLDALSTLAFDYPPRADFFRSELRQFLLLAREEKVDPVDARGSYAGAMGSPQFIPSSYRNFAVDADGDGHRDLWSNWDDVIGSVANYMRMHGWRAGEPVIVTAKFDGDAARFNTVKSELNETVKSLRDKGVRFDTRLADDAPAMLVVAQGKDGPEYRVGFNNFFVITQYNRSKLYAMAVHDLGAAVRAAIKEVAR